MTLLLPFLGMAAVLIGCFGFWAMTLQRRWAQWIAAVIFLPLLCASLFIGSLILGRPKPMAIEVMNGEARLIAYVVVPGEAIYVWLLLPGLMEPVAYSLPYSTQAERQLHEAQRTAGEDGAVGVLVDGLFPQGEQMFWPMPQAELPPKEGQ